MAKLPAVLIEQSPIPGLIYSHYEKKAREEARLSNGIGCSQIGYSCQRRIWYSFHWCPEDEKEGRIYRLFDTGKREEFRIVEELRAIGINVLELNPETNDQWRVEMFGGHYSGYMDGICLNVPESPKTWHAAEFKTHSKYSFGELVKKGLEKAKPEHYAQCMSVMNLATPKLTRCLYFACCKDNDEIYVERVKYNATQAKALEDKCLNIIEAAQPPAKVSDSPESWDCKLCPHRSFCHNLHGAKLPTKNCRTCLHSTAVKDGTWFCAKHSKLLTPELQRVGCDNHLFLPHLLPWLQVDADNTRIHYKDINGNDVFNHEGGEISNVPF